MNAVECALAKQRLQLAAAAQRSELAGHVAGIVPLFAVADQAQAGVRWLRRNPEIFAATTALLLAVRPGARRFAWRWGRRAFIAWRVWRDSDRWLGNSIRHRPPSQ